MKQKIIKTGALALCALFMLNCKVKLNTEDKKVSYAIGHSIGKGVKQQKPDVDIAKLGKGIIDGLGKKENAEMAKDQNYSVGLRISKNLPAQDLMIDQSALVAGLEAGGKGEAGQMTEEETRATIMAFQNRIAEKNSTAGKAFLEENKKKPGVQVTKSGLQYKVVKAGAGARPNAKSTVKVHYRGKLISGEEFDSSYQRNQPAEFPVSGVIRGWTEGLQLMQVGSKYEFTIPSDLGYGASGNQRIPPASVLLFEVELLQVK